MTTAGPIIQVWTREYGRMLSWIASKAKHVSALELAVGPLISCFYAACQGLETHRGPYFDLYTRVEMPLRRALETNGYYLPVNALRTIDVPSEEELVELCDAYTLIGTAAQTSGLSWEARAVAATALHAFYSIKPEKDFQAWSDLRKEEAHQVWSIMIDSLAARQGVTDDEWAGWQADFRAREITKSLGWRKRWLEKLEA